MARRPVRAASSAQLVLARLAAQRVVPRAALDLVVAGTRLDEVVPAPAEDPVVALAGLQQVAATTTLELQVPGERVAEDQVGSGSPRDGRDLDRAQRRDLVGLHEPRSCVVDLPIAVAGQRDRVATLAADRLSSARTGGEVIATPSAHQRIDPAAADQVVTDLRTDERVVPQLPRDGGRRQTIERRRRDVDEAHAIRSLAGEHEDATQVGARGGSARRMVVVHGHPPALAPNGDVVRVGRAVHREDAVGDVRDDRPSPGSRDGDHPDACERGEDQHAAHDTDARRADGTGQRPRRGLAATGGQTSVSVCS